MLNVLINNWHKQIQHSNTELIIMLNVLNNN